MSFNIDIGTRLLVRFGAGGQLTARVDCNRGRGTWKSSGESAPVFEPVPKAKGYI